ncbi:MAG: hypothetical protein CfP315_0857 [Candidatus Improbicoccus pseudotrichonymphae]|uniref:Chromosome partition protein Smc n=1 Tax=Candidatus Improbicoccus pseudotrichonymphae TaxID=3033792 RepID=A0AA48KXC1_9FIRM|nr:MAG: hypothetical protein CfP315_0857 [Candidatus Improbicoccus pseudotrichonymphae]
MIVKKYLATFLSLFYMNVAFAKVTALGENQPEKTTLEDGNTFEEEEKLEEKEELEKPKDDKSKKLNPESKESAKDLLYGFLSGTAIGSVVTAVGSYAFNKSRATGVYEKGVSEKLEELVKKCKSAIGEDGKNCENYEDDLSRLEKIVDSLVSKMAEASEESKELEASKMQLERELNSCKSKIQELSSKLSDQQSAAGSLQSLKGKITESEKENDKLMKENNSLEEKRDELKKRIQEKSEELNTSKEWLLQLEQTFNKSKSQEEIKQAIFKEVEKLREKKTELERKRDESIRNLQEEKIKLEEERNELIKNFKKEICSPGKSSINSANDLLQELSSIKSNMIKMINSLGHNYEFDNTPLEKLLSDLNLKKGEKLNDLKKQLFDLEQELRASEAEIEKLNNELKNRGTSGAVPALEENKGLVGEKIKLIKSMRRSKSLERLLVKENRLVGEKIKLIKSMRRSESLERLEDRLVKENNKLIETIGKFRKAINLDDVSVDNVPVNELSKKLSDDFLEKWSKTKKDTNDLLATIGCFKDNKLSGRLVTAISVIENDFKYFDEKNFSYIYNTALSHPIGEQRYQNLGANSVVYFLSTVKTVFKALLGKIEQARAKYSVLTREFVNRKQWLEATIRSHKNTIIAMNINFERRMGVAKLYYTQPEGESPE